MNDTPRTQKHRLDCTEYDGHVPHSDGDWVCAEFAEELERELNAAMSALERLRDCDWVISLPDRMDAVRDIARDAIAAINNSSNPSRQPRESPSVGLDGVVGSPNHEG